LMLFETLVALLAVPFRAWCQWRHRRYWVIAPFGWSWVCELDGFEWPFSTEDVKRIIG
jgi:hypothetical protein